MRQSCRKCAPHTFSPILERGLGRVSKWHYVEGGKEIICLFRIYIEISQLVPQGTRLAPLLFAILVNNLVKDWETRVKYVDDLSVLAGVILDIIPRCSTSMLPFIARDIFSYASRHGVKLNPSKCKSYA